MPVQGGGVGGAGEAPVRLPGRLFWIPLLVIDLALLLALAEAHRIAGAILLGAAAVVLALHPAAALALGATGLPLFQPLSRVTGDLRWSFFLGLLILFLPALPLAWNALWSGTHLRRIRAALTSRLWLLTVLLGILLYAGLLWTPSPVYGGDKAQLYLLVNLVLAGLALVYLRRDRPGLPRPATLFLAAIALLQILIAVAAVWNYNTHVYMWWGRLKTLGLNPIWTARHAGLGILCLLALTSMRRCSWIAALPAIALLGWVFVMAASRGPTLALALALGFFAFLAPERMAPEGRAVRRLVRALPGVLVLFLAALPGLLRQSDTAGRELSNEVRLRLLEAARDALSGISLLGLGTGGFPHLLGLPDQRFYPHNVFLEVLLENGLLGLALFAGFLLVVYREWRRWGRVLERSGETGPEQALWRACGAIFVYAVLNAQFSGDLWVNEWIWLWGGVICAWAPERMSLESPAPPAP